MSNVSGIKADVAFSPLRTGFFLTRVKNGETTTYQFSINHISLFVIAAAIRMARN